MAARRQHSARPRLEKKYCMAHPINKMDLGFRENPESILGAVEEMFQKSKNDKLLRKKYIGVCR